MTKRRLLCVLLAATALTAACGSSAGTEPSAPIAGLSVVVKSSEWTAEKNLMVVGEEASAEIEPLTDHGCPFPPVSGPPTYCPTPAVVQVRSSNPAVVGPAEQQVGAPATVTLVARAPGTTDLTVRVDTVTRLVHIEVSSEPLPLDAIQILSVDNSSQNMTSVDLGVEAYVAFRLVALRSGVPVYGLPLFTLTRAHPESSMRRSAAPIRGSGHSVGITRGRCGWKARRRGMPRSA